MNNSLSEATSVHFHPKGRGESTAVSTRGLCVIKPQILRGKIARIKQQTARRIDL